MRGSFALAKGEEGWLPFSLPVPAGVTPNAGLEVDVEVTNLREQTSGARRRIRVEAPPHHRTMFRLLAEELETPLTRYRPSWLGGGLMAVYRPSGALRRVLDEVCLEVSRPPHPPTAELTLNLAERRPLDYLRAVVGKDRIRHALEFHPEAPERLRAELRQLLRPCLTRIQAVEDASASTLP